MNTIQLIRDSEVEGMNARRMGMTERSCPYSADIAGDRDMAYSWLSGWETCDEEMKSLNVLTTAKDFADAADISKLDEYSQHLFRVMQHALRDASSLTE
jgi:hypothetical protein